MDSIYEQPRCVPRPVSSNDRFVRPSVPEVSLVFQDKLTQDIDNPNTKISPNDYMSYNAWKIQNKVQQKENLEEMKEAALLLQPISRKQVRFEGQSQQSFPHLITETARNINPQQTNGLPTIKNGIPSSTLISKPFEEIYMQNIPSRHLDLSIIDMQPRKDVAVKNSIISQNSLQEDPAKGTYKDYSKLASQKNQIYQQEEPRPINNCKKLSNQRMNQKRNISNNNCIEKVNYNERNLQNYNMQNVRINQESSLQKQNDEPTTKDLLKIIQQQNEQILILQKQVTSLLNIQEQCKQIEAPPPNNPPIYGLCNPQYDSIPGFTRTPDKKSTNSKFAIDVMTSFEVSIRPQQNFPRKYPNDLFGKSKICEIEEVTTAKNSQNNAYKNANYFEIENKSNVTEDATDKSDCSLVINGTIQVPEEIPSPENSIHVDMQDYSSESEDDFVTTDLGWTIYNNIMGQVNNVLYQRQKRQMTEPLNRSNCSSNVDKAKEKTMRKVKEATIKHLKQIGIDVNHIPSDFDSSSDSSGEALESEGFNPNEISFAVKQLLMKYLPNEELVKITNNPKPKPNKKNVCLMKDGKRRPELSFATVQYMKKYNLLAKDVQSSPKVKLDNKSPKFLDITALKQQPKLL